MAVTPSTEESGCLSFLPGTHHSQLPHTETREKTNMLSLGQEVDRSISDGLIETAVTCPLGQARS